MSNKGCREPAWASGGIKKNIPARTTKKMKRKAFRPPSFLLFNNFNLLPEKTYLNFTCFYLPASKVLYF
ncbi:MAG TPA: hypothetical protein DD719_04415 [Desulfotomaculum sp.]|nr:hypothetical protein [Desulfotomaculum sp.]